MSREWAAVYSAMLTKPKYKRLSAMGRGALLHAFLLAGMQRPEATWDPEELRETLILDGFPEGVYGELLGLGWLELEDGVALLHDWDEHQYAATLEVKRTWEAARKREWRKKKREVATVGFPTVRGDQRPATPSPTPLTPETEHHNTPQDIGPGHVPDMSRTQVAPEVVGVYEELFGPASPPKLQYLSNILRRWPADRVIAGLRVEHGLGATRKNICGRLEDGLSRKDKADAAATMRVIEGKVAS